MRKVTAEHEVACSSDKFWELFFGKEFNDELYLKVLQCSSFEILEQSDTARRLLVSPKVNMPKAVMKLMGDSFSYEERGTFDPDKGIWSYEVLPNALKGKLTNNGTVRCVSLGEGRCKRVDEMKVEAKVFGLGSIIEGSTEKEVLGAWDHAAVFMNDWIKKNG
jgi:hypothetical protein